MTASRRAVLAALAGGALGGCARPGGPGAAAGIATATPAPQATPVATGTPGLASPAAPAGEPAVTRAEVVARYGDLKPDYWGFGTPGVARSLPAARPVIALTFDACGGRGGSGYDQALIGFLRQREIPATLFLNSRWIDDNPAAARRLADESLFEIANHGTRHLPLSVTGRPAYGITGTRSAGEVYDEVAGNQLKLTRLPPPLRSAAPSAPPGRALSCRAT